MPWQTRSPLYVNDYSLQSPADKKQLTDLDVDLVWVTGWQRLIPEWLIAHSKYGAVGVHGSPDGIHGGRGRSPQNWALMLGIKHFDLSLFKITAGVDNGPILASKTIYYNDYDDIATSHHRVALATAEMIIEVLAEPNLLFGGITQPEKGHYFPQRKPNDGRVVWNLSQQEITNHCRALTKPYPGLRTKHDQTTIIIWSCMPFDDITDGNPGTISVCFGNGDFLVNCNDGRLSIRSYTANPNNWKPQAGMLLQSTNFASQLKQIVKRHKTKYPEQDISPRISKLLEK